MKVTGSLDDECPRLDRLSAIKILLLFAERAGLFIWFFGVFWKASPLNSTNVKIKHASIQQQNTGKVSLALFTAPSPAPTRSSFAVKSGVSLIISCHARRWRWLRVHKLQLILWLQKETKRKFL